MRLFSQESDIVKTMRLIEELKAELIHTVGELYGALARNSVQQSKEALALLIAEVYVLGKRLGINFDELDEAVLYRVKECGKDSGELENRFGDFSKLARHLQQKR